MSRIVISYALVMLTAAACTQSVRIATLDYYKNALLLLDNAVRSGTTHAIDTIPRACYQSDACVEQRTAKWFSALSSISGASKHLRDAYSAKDEDDRLESLACSVTRLRDVNAILLDYQPTLPADYTLWYAWLDAQTRGLSCNATKE